MIIKRLIITKDSQPLADTLKMSKQDSNKDIETHTRFWGLVDEYEIPHWQLSQICNAPIKVLVSWYDNRVPTDALHKLLRHLNKDKETGLNE